MSTPQEAHVDPLPSARGAGVGYTTPLPERDRPSQQSPHSTPPVRLVESSATLAAMSQRSGLHTRNPSTEGPSLTRRSSTAVLTEAVRRHSSRFSDFSKLDDMHAAGDHHRTLFALPNFSTASLMAAWVLSVVGSVICYVLAEVHQEDYLAHQFPLPYIASLSCHLSILSGCIVYVMGRQHYGARVYRFYQPFAGGQRFFVLQFFGVFCLSVSFLSTAAYVQVLARPEDVRPGVFLAIAALTTLGSVFIYLSPRHFEAAAQRARSTPAEGRARHEFSLGELLDILRVPPNTESAIVCTVAAAQGLVYVVALYAKPMTVASAWLVLIMQVFSGVLIHCFIGCRALCGYRPIMLALPRSIDTFAYWLFWITYSASLIGDRFCLRLSRSGEWTKLPVSFHTGILGLNTFATMGLLMFVRSTTFYKRAGLPPATLLEAGGFAVVIASLLLGAFNVFSVVHTQMFASAVEPSLDTRNTARAIHVGFFMGQSFALMLPPMVQVVGKGVHGIGFSILHSYRGYPFFALAQGYGWLSYVSGLFCFALFALTGNGLAGSGAAVLAALSTLSITASLREYGRFKWMYAAAVDADTRAAGGVAGGVRGTSAAEVAEAPPPPQTLADVVRSATEAPELDASSASFTYILNGEMMGAYILALSNIVVRAIEDVYADGKITHRHVAVIDLSGVTYAMFFLSVPLAHMSGRDKGIRVLRPFSGSSIYVALQVLGWFIYTAVIASIVISSILAMEGSRVPVEVHRSFMKLNYSKTIPGMLQLIPLILITISIAHESVAIAVRRRQRALAKEAFVTIRDVLRAELRSAESDEERAVMQLAFSTLMVPALEHYELTFGRKATQLYRPRTTAETGEAADQDGFGGVTDVESPVREHGGDLDDEEGEGEDAEEESQDEVVDDLADRRQKQEGARVIAILLSCATATLFVAAAFFSKVAVFSLACAVCGLLLCTVECIGMHVGYGLLLHGRRGAYSVFMPFTGGPAFVYRQILGWTCYAGTVLITLIAGLEDQGVSAGAMIAAAALSVMSPVSILSSVPYFTVDTHRDRRSFLEENAEGVIAMLAFSGAFAFAHTYRRTYDFFYSEGGVADEGVAGAAVGALMPNVSRRNRVPFVLALLSIVVAIPFVLIAMARTTRQWELIARKARRQLHRQRLTRQHSASTTSSQPGGETDASRGAHGRRPRASARSRDAEAADDDETPLHPHRQKRADRGILAVALQNLLEVAMILFCTAAPLAVLFLAYYVAYNWSPRTLDVVTSCLPTAFYVALGTVLLSLIPHVASLGLSEPLICFRAYVVTYCLYSMPVLVASVLLGPAFLYPCLGTRFLAATTLVVAIVGNYKQVRRVIKFTVYSLFGYTTYCLALALQEHVHDGGRLASPRVARLAVDYVVDAAFLFFWIWYLPLFHGRPEFTGAQRSDRFTHFARHYLWEETVRFFNFRVIIDDPTVNMREGGNRYLFSFHPHGVFPGTALFATVTKDWERKVGLNPSSYVSTHAASIIFNVPLIRDFNLRQGALSVSRRGLEASLARGNSVLIVTGGQAEMLHTKISDTALTLVTQHKGFIRIAIRNKVPMVPLLCFGEQNVLGLVQFPRVQRVMIKLLGFPFPMFPYGGFGLPLPRRTRLSLVVGKPIPIPDGADPDDEELVQRLSKAYFDELKEVFYRNRVEAGFPNLELILVDDHAEAQKRKAAAAKGAKAATEGKVGGAPDSATSTQAAT